MRRYTKEEEQGQQGNKKSDSQIQSSITTSKVVHHFPQPMPHYQEQDPTSPVTIYLRSSSKKSAKIEVTSKISMSDIKVLAEQKLGMSKDRQILHLNGKNVTEYGYIRLQSQNIIHITSSDTLLLPNQEISIKVKLIDSFLSSPSQNKIYTIRTDQNIAELAERIKKQKPQFQSQVEKPYYFFLESSRLLEKQKSFHQQQISGNTQLICLITKHELKTRFSNDTKEEILHDISQLLGFQDEPAETKEPEKKQEKPIRSRYQRHIKDQNNDRSQQVSSNTSKEEQLEDPILNKNMTTPNFKKKAGSKQKIYSESDYKPLTKIKATKSKRQLQLLLKAETEISAFQPAQPIKQLAKQQSKKSDKDNIEDHKPTASIPKVMPVQQRRKIRLEIQKLFDFNSPEGPSQPEVKEQEKPKSPPTEVPVRQERQKDKMRFSMGSRPAFLDQLRLASKGQ